jgi:pre-mRNA-splicing factor ISY1
VAYKTLAEALGLPEPSPDSIPAIPRPKPTSLLSSAVLKDEASEDTEMTDGDAPPAPKLPLSLSVLESSDLAPPKLPTKAEMENILLELRKRALLEEYIGDSK